MAYVPVPKDLTTVKTKVLFNLTKRQLICFSGGALVGVPLYFLLKGPAGFSAGAASLCMVLVMLPFFLMAVYEKNGLPLEKILRNIARVLLLRPQARFSPDYIDRQKNAENAYFLDAVTDKDLLALAKSDNEDVSGSSSSKTASAPERSFAPTASTSTVSSASHTEKQDNSAGIAAVAVLAAVLVGAAVWFFKFRKPGKKDKNRPDPDDYDYTGDEGEESEPEDELEVPDGETAQKGESETSDDETEREDE